MQLFYKFVNIVSGCRVVFFGCFIFFYTLNNTHAQTLTKEETADITIYGDVEFFVDSLEQVYTPGSLTGIDGATVRNNGTIIFDVNDNFKFINNYSSENLFLGKGSYFFTGNGDFYIGGDFQNRLSNIYIDKSDGARIYLESNLAVTDTLYLLSGKVETGSEHFLIVQNRDNRSLRLSDYRGFNNQQYIIGNLRRFVAKDSSYIFPVGLQSTYFPLTIENVLDDAQSLDVTFKEDVPLNGDVNFQLGLYNFQDLNQTGAWKVNSDVTSSSGYMNLNAYLFDFMEKSRLETNMFGLVFNKDPKGNFDEWTLEGNYDLPGRPSRLANSDSTLLFNTNKFGYYTLATADITKLINFIAPGGGRESRFIIPSIERYETTELIVYNAMGRQIFKDKPYKNNLDMKDYKDGTYYYIFKYTRNGRPGVIQSFIDVKRVY